MPQDWGIKQKPSRKQKLVYYCMRIVTWPAHDQLDVEFANFIFVIQHICFNGLRSSSNLLFYFYYLPLVLVSTAIRHQRCKGGKHAVDVP